MMIKKSIRMLMVIFLVVSIFAQDEEEEEEKKVKAKEIRYDQPTEWSLYNADKPVVTFTISGDELWYATEEMVYCASIKKHTVQNYPKLGSLPATEVTSMTTDRTTVWIGGKNGVAMKGGKDFTVYTAENGLPDNSVNALGAGGGKVWIGTDKGLAMYSGGSFKKFTVQDGLPHEKIQAIIVDDNGKVWVGTPKGIGCYDGSKWTVYNMKNGLSWNNVKTFAYDPRKNTIWAAVGDKDINSFSNGKWSVYMEIQEGITSLMVDTQSRLWVGSTSGLMKYNGEEWINDPKKLNIPATQVNWMMRDSAGNLYFACENGIVRLLNPYPY
ncbi:MAG: hypothetical protein N2053_02105 [Chitinispirillaceae bacterium]|nr:hypothetical protein [Chitinispirillaceae bacterium]